MSLDVLTQNVADHLAGQKVHLRWEHPESLSALGQVVKKFGQLYVYVDPNIVGEQTKLKIYLHELAHCRLDKDFVPETGHQAKPVARVKRSDEDRAAWRAHPREHRAHNMADVWYQFADKNAWKFYTGSNTTLECQLKALLKWRE